MFKPPVKWCNQPPAVNRKKQPESEKQFFQEKRRGNQPRHFHFAHWFSH